MKTITMTEEQFNEAIEKAVMRTVQPVVSATLENLGIPTTRDWLWITQSAAMRMLGRGKLSAGRRRLEKAMKEGRIQWEKKDFSSRQSRVVVNINDVKKLMKEPV